MTHDKTEFQLYDDPASKIRFLEVALGDQEWHARIHLPDFIENRDCHAAKLTGELSRRGYHVTKHNDADGHMTLQLHHLGTSPDIGGLFKEYGLTTGAAHVIQNPMASLKALTDGIAATATHGAQYITDPARANGLIFLTAEGFLIMAAGGNKHGKWYQPKNLLQGTAGAFFASQSAAYLFWAQKGDDRIAHDLTKQLKTKSFDELPDAKALNERKTNSLINKGRRALEDHPIQAGAILNNAGMLAYMAHAVMERKYRQTIPIGHEEFAQAQEYLTKGFKWEMGGILLSMFGWSSLLLKPQEYEEKSSNPITRIWQSYREDPQHVTGITSLLSSTSRLRGALKKPNYRQAIGEGLYIPGDILLFFVKNHDYGASRHGDYGDLTTKISKVIEAMPMVVSPEHQEKLFESTAKYLAKQHAALSGDENIDIEKESAILRTGLHQCCAEELSSRYDKLVGAARRLVRQFPAGQQLAVGEKLAEIIPTLSGVQAEKHELQEWLCAKPEKDTRNGHMPTMDELATPIGQLTFTIPGPHAGQNALAVYQALAPLIQTQPTDEKTLEDGMMKEAEQVMAMAETPAWQSKALASESVRTR